MYGLLQDGSQPKATDRIVREIQDLVVSKKLEPGQKLPSERDLAERFGVSRSILREALGVLRQRGLVDVSPGRGTVVRNPGLDSIQDPIALLIQLRNVSLVELCDVRLLIEPQLARRAASLPKSVDMRKLIELGERLDATSGEPHEHVRVDLQFHREIATLAGHGLFSAIVGVVMEPVSRSMMLGAAKPKVIEASDEHHRAILEGIVERKPEQAHQAMVEHIQYVSGYISEKEAAIKVDEGES
jgi:GntR family transcriptional repressor for pyruvate dehydrogenase complex